MQFDVQQLLPHWCVHFRAFQEIGSRTMLYEDLFVVLWTRLACSVSDSSRHSQDSPWGLGFAWEGSGISMTLPQKLGQQVDRTLEQCGDAFWDHYHS